MLATHHGRDQIAYVKIGATRDGKITAFHAKILQDLGAYLMLLTPTIPSLGAFVMSGVYDIPAVHTDITGVFTNKMPTDAIRGAGRPEATHMIEMMIDQLADELGMDRLELRRKNFMQPESFPHETAIGVVYDSGDYPEALDTLLALRRRGASRPRRRPASCAGSATPPTRRSAASRRPASPGRRASACRPACGSRRWCACTSPAR